MGDKVDKSFHNVIDRASEYRADRLFCVGLQNPTVGIYFLYIQSYHGKIFRLIE